MGTKMAGDDSKRSRGRPRAFDREQALDRAMEVFWRRGYEGASLAELTAAMGVTPPSLYSAFGSKEGLYREALRQYVTSQGAGAGRALAEEPTAFRAIERMLRESVRIFADPTSPAGCMISTATLRCAPENRSAAAAASEMRQAMLASMRDVLAAAVAAGELPADVDAEGLARFYGAVVQGMSVQAIDGAGTDALNAIVDAALRAWPGKTGP
jgi:AcrR family transcriptional regulator